MKKKGMNKTTELSARYFRAFLNRILLPEKAFYLAVLVYAVAIGLLTLAVPVAVQTFINTVANIAIAQSLLILTVLLFVLLGISAVIQALQHYTMEMFERRFFSRISVEITDALLLAPEEQANQSTKIDRFFEVMHVQKSLPSLCVGGFTLGFQMVIGFVVVSLYHPWFLMFNLVVIALAFFIWRLWHERAHVGAHVASDARYEMAGWLEKLAVGDASARTPDGQRITHQETQRIAEGYLRGREKFFGASFAQIIGFLLIYVLGSGCLLGIGGWLVLQGQLSIGQLVAAELILSAIFYGFARVGYYLGLYYELCAGAVKLDELLSVAGWQSSELANNSSVIQSVNLPRPTKIAVRLIFMTVVASIAALIFVPWIQTSAGTGSIISLHPAGQMQSVSAPVTGRIAKWYVNSGSVVKAGEPIVEIVDNDPNIIERMTLERDSALAAQKSAKLAMETASLDVGRKKDLYKQGLVARRDYEMAKIEYASWQAKYAEATQAVAVAETKLSRQHAQLVRAPRSGRIQQTLAGDTSTIVKEGDKLATFAPEASELVAEVFVRGLDAPLIQPGRSVQLQFEGWPVIQFSGWPSVSVGTFAGKVLSIDSAVSDNGLYRVLVEPTPAQAWPDERYLRLGSRVKGWVQLNEVSLGYELWRQLNGFPPMPTNPDSVRKP